MIQHYIDDLGTWHELPDVGFEFLLTRNHPGRTFTPKTQGEYDAAQAAIIPAAVPLTQQAMTELNKVTGPSGTIMRCMVAAVAIPPAWSAYVSALRAIAKGADTTSTALPPRPDYPLGT